MDNNQQNLSGNSDRSRALIKQNNTKDGSYPKTTLHKDEKLALSENNKKGESIIFGASPGRKIFNIGIIIIIIAFMWGSGFFDRLSSKYDFYSDKGLQVYVVFVPDELDNEQINIETKKFIRFDKNKLPDIIIDKIYVLNSSKKIEFIEYNNNHVGFETKIFVAENAIGYVGPSSGEFSPSSSLGAY